MADTLSVRDAVTRIEEKRALLSWLKGQTDISKVTFENYMCLASVLQKDGWTQAGEGRWMKSERTLPMLDAAKASVAETLDADTKAHLRRTVTNFKF